MRMSCFTRSLAFVADTMFYVVMDITSLIAEAILPENR